ncbi:MAG: cell division protein FtsQ/DivIB [Solirubrobacteraceae bacterium]
MSPIAGFVTRLQDHRGTLPFSLPRLGGLVGAGGPRTPGPGRAPRGPEPGPGRRRLAWTVGLAVVGLIAATYLVLRLTGLSAVQNVTVVGLQGPNAPELRAAIERAATGQSTLAFDDGAIRRVTDDVASVTRVEASPRFPHGVQIEVEQRVAVGALERGGERVAIAADGALIADWPTGELPLVSGARSSGDRIAASASGPVSILAAAPTELLPTIDRIERGTVVRMKNGPTLLFRDASRLRAKWIAATAVLGDEATGGVSWIDLRVPDQPLAGRGTPPSLPKRSTKAPEPDGVAAGSSSASSRSAASSGSGTGPGTGTGTGDAPAAPGATGTTGTGAGATTGDGAPAPSTGQGATGGQAAAPSTITQGPATGAGEPSGGTTTPDTTGGTATATGSTDGSGTSTGGQTEPESGGAAPTGTGETP